MSSPYADPAQAFYFGSGSRPEGPKPEAQRAGRSGSGVLGESQLASSTPAVGLRE